MKAKTYTLIGFLFILSSFIWGGYNIYSDVHASNIAQEVTKELEQNVEENQEEWNDVYIDVPLMEMPVVEINGRLYVGTLDIPKLNLSLPILNESNQSNLKIAPCRYHGSIYTNDMVIAAHNYRSHFARINKLVQHDQIKFTDMDGNEFIYEVIGIEVLKPTDVELMIHSEYDLTLYTCTVGGANRITVRCNLIEK